MRDAAREHAEALELLRLLYLSFEAETLFFELHFVRAIAHGADDSRRVSRTVSFHLRDRGEVAPAAVSVKKPILHFESVTRQNRCGTL